MCSMEGFFQSVQRTGSNVSKHHPTAANVIAGNAAFLQYFAYIVFNIERYSAILSLAKSFSANLLL